MKPAALRWFELSLVVGLAACGDTNSEPSAPSPGPSAPSPGPSAPSPEQEPEVDAAVDEELEPCEVPSDPSALLDYLRSGAYKDFARETAPHPSTGPHAGGVLTYVNDLLAASLDAGAAEHPRCAASIKELFLGKDEVSGWAVFVRAEEESRSGRGYYWLEVTRTDATRADYEGHGIGICVGCHSAGRDYFRSPWPLQ
jgi:hypothetical protein